MANFSAGLPLNHSGYDILFQPVRFFRADPSRFISEFSDPRGLFRSGMVPADTLSYRIYYRTSENIVSTVQQLAAGAAFGIGILLGAPEVVFTRSKTRTAITFFEGRDVIDLPTKDLKHDGDAIVLPDKVFRVLHAGSEKFLQSKEDISRRASTVLTRLNKDQMEKLKVDQKEIDRIIGDPDQVLKVVISPNAPFDMQKADPLFARFFVDTASNKVKLKGSPQFISYVAVDRNLYRDVVTTTSSAQAVGIVLGAQPLLILNTSAGQTQTAYVMRFAFINVSTNPDVTDFRWRLSESYNIAAGQAQATPSDLVANMSTEEVTRNSLASVFKHYVYDLADLADDTTNEEFSTPIKNAFSPALARAKMDETSSYFDPNFKAQIVGFKLGLGATGTLVTPLAVGASTTQAVLFPEWEYTSAFYTPILGPNARIGYEYTFWKSGAVAAISVPNDVIILAKSKPTTGGISAFRDPCIDTIELFTVEDTVIHRRYYDARWTANRPIKPPKSKLEAFMIGEMPYRSTGMAASRPLQGEILTVNGTSGNISLPVDKLPTILIASSETNVAEAIIKLFADQNGTEDSQPVFETTVRKTDTGYNVHIPVPPINFKSYAIKNAGNVSLIGFLGAPKKDFLPTLKGSTGLQPISQLQVDEIESEDFPILGESIAGAIMSTKGHACIAYTVKDRLDLAYRSSSLGPFLPIRDITLRITDAAAKGTNLSDSEKTFPAVGQPFMLSDLGQSKLLVFYTYKKRLLLKTIPIGLLTENKIDPSLTVFPAPIEAALINTMHKLIPVVIYDGGINNKKDKIEVDIQYGAISGNFEAAGANDPSTTAGPASYSVCISSGGTLYAFIEDGNRIRLRISGDKGRTWKEATLPDNFYFLPQRSDSGTTNFTDSGTDGQYPYVYFHEGKKTVLMFYFSGTSLLHLQIPESILLLKTPQEVAESIAKIKPEIIFGERTDELKERGIPYSPLVLERKEKLKADFHEFVSAHQISVAMTESGHLRLFFRDDFNTLKSLISADSGRTWMTEDQYLEAGKKV